MPLPRRKKTYCAISAIERHIIVDNKFKIRPRFAWLNVVPIGLYPGRAAGGNMQAGFFRQAGGYAGYELLGGCPRMLFFPISALFSENQCSQVSEDSDINYMAVLDFLKMP
jgi:hypothetical protein